MVGATLDSFASTDLLTKCGLRFPILFLYGNTDTRTVDTESAGCS